MEVTHNNLPQAISCLLDEICSLKTIIHNQVKKEDESSNERLTRKEIRAQYKVCYATIHNLMKKGDLPYSKIGRKTLFRRDDIERIFKTQMTKSYSK